MSFPLGVFPAAAGASIDSSSVSGSFRSRKSEKTVISNEGTASSKGGFEKSPGKFNFTKKHQKSLSNRTLIANKRVRAGSSPVKVDRKASLEERPESTPARGIRSPHIQFAEPSRTSSGLSDSSRRRHVPIVIPDYVPVDAAAADRRSNSFSSWISRNSDNHGAPDYQVLVNRTSIDLGRSKPRHVEIKIPTWAHPLAKQSEAPHLDLSQSTFDPFPHLASISPPDMSRPTPDSSRASTMDSNTPAPGIYANANNSGSHAYLSSANSSQSSLVGKRDDYESASESESSQNGDTPSQSTGPSPAPGQSTSESHSASLSGLVCNVHRTTGREPPPLVGASTTVLGDKVYVFGGRRLSRSRPHLISSLYELDLVRRHWTRLEVTGDIPLPRYFHTVCPLGDTKLVCYGGMTPASPPAEGSTTPSSEVLVLSDIHIYDVLTKSWMKLNTPDAPQGRYAHCAAILPSSAVFASANAPMSAVQHNPAGSNPNQGSLGVSLDGAGGAEMVVVGGQDSANNYIEQVSVFNLRSLKWSGTTGMGRSCGAYRSVVTPLTTMSSSQIGAGQYVRPDIDDEDDDELETIGSGAPMLIYSNYNFMDVKLELQVRLKDGTLTEKPMKTTVSPPGLRFPNGGIIANHFIVSGTFLTSSKQEYALWALDLRTLTWGRIDAGGNVFSQGSWNRGVLWNRRNAFVILGNRKRSLVDDYNARRMNFSNICVVELEAFGLYENPRHAEPMSAYLSASAAMTHADKEFSAAGRQISKAAEDLGAMSMEVRELADMDILALDGTRIPVNSKLIARRWGSHFVNLLRDNLALAVETDTATLRPSAAGHPSRNSSVTITPSVTSGATTITANSGSDTLDTRSIPPSSRARLFYLPHTAPVLQALLHYLYTSNLPSPPHPLAQTQIFCSLLQLARPYKIDGLLEAVVERLHASLDISSAAAIFNAAAMGAGGGHGVQFTTVTGSVRDSTIPLRTASLAGIDGLTNGTGRSSSALRIDTEMANGRNTRNTLRPGQPLTEHSEEDEPTSATTDASMSDFEGSSSGRNDRSKDQEVWHGRVSAVIGLQKRGLRGLMEGRRMRERGRSEPPETRVGLGIA